MKVIVSTTAAAAVIAIVAASSLAGVSEAFTVPAGRAMTTTAAVSRPSTFAIQSTEEDAAATEAVFVPPSEESEDEEVSFEAVESLGRGAAKAKRGKRKGASSSSSTLKTKASVTLAPEEVFYEGPPAITETIAPTLSILTVVGIVPAAAAWARQAWVRYKITTRRVRVTSGLGGKDMAEIVYPDVVELRTAKRLFGDGDMVLFLRDGAKFELRNVPEFDDAVEFILKQLDKDVADEYRRSKSDLTTPQA